MALRLGHLKVGECCIHPTAGACIVLEKILSKEIVRIQKVDGEIRQADIQCKVDSLSLTTFLEWEEARQ